MATNRYIASYHTPWVMATNRYIASYHTPWDMATNRYIASYHTPWVAPMVIHIQPLRGFKSFSVEPINTTSFITLYELHELKKKCQAGTDYL
jgi:hypothetical protein